VIEEMHCFSSSTTTLMVIELKEEIPPRPNVPPYEDLEEASASGLFFRTVRCGPYFQAAALIESIDRHHLGDMRIKGWSPLHESVQREDASEARHLTKLLLANRCDPNAKDDEWQQTPLYFAANMDRVGIAKMLVEYNADANHRDIHYQPALFYAAKHNSMDVAKYFIGELGISPNVKDKAGRRAMFYARQANADASHAEIIAYLEEQEGKRRRIAVPKTPGRPIVDLKESRTMRASRTSKCNKSRITRKLKA